MNFGIHSVLMNQTGDAPPAGGGSQAPATSALGGAKPPSALDVTPPDPTAINNLPEWLKGVDPEYATDKSLSSIKDIPSLVKSYVHAQKLVGKDKVVLPDSNSTDQDWKNFYSKLGLPNDLKEYNIGYDENKSPLDKGFVEELQKFAYENNILPKQAEKLYKFYEQKAIEEQKMEDASVSQQAEVVIKDLREEWGPKYDYNMGRAVEVLNLFGKDMNMLEHVEKSGLGNDKTFIKFLVKTADALKEDTFKHDAIPQYGKSKADAKDEINSIMGNPDHPYWKPEHPGHKKAIADLNNMYEILEK